MQDLDLFGPKEAPCNFPNFFNAPYQATYVAFRQLSLADQVSRLAEIVTKEKITWTDNDKVILIALYRTSQDTVKEALKKLKEKLPVHFLNEPIFHAWCADLTHEDQFARPRNASSDHTKVALVPDALVRLSRKPSPQNPSVNSSSASGRTTTTYHCNLRPCLSGTANFFWKNRNAGQRAGEILLPTAGLSAIFGAVSAQSTTLTAVGSAAAKFLPSFVASFGLTHAVPPAALAFYAIAGALAAAALVLLIASTVYQCSHKPKNDHFVFADWDHRPPTYY